MLGSVMPLAMFKLEKWKVKSTKRLLRKRFREKYFRQICVKIVFVIDEKHERCDCVIWNFAEANFHEIYMEFGAMDILDPNLTLSADNKFTWSYLLVQRHWFLESGIVAPPPPLLPPPYLWLTCHADLHFHRIYMFSHHTCASVMRNIQKRGEVGRKKRDGNGREGECPSILLFLILSSSCHLAMMMNVYDLFPFKRLPSKHSYFQEVVPLPAKQVYEIYRIYYL